LGGLCNSADTRAVQLEYGLRVTFSCEIKRVTGANDDQIAAALGDLDVRMGAHYTRHVEQEARIIEVFFTKQLRSGSAVGTRTEQDLSNREGQASTKSLKR
jgi:hypothetical protein